MTAAAPISALTLVYDGSCGLCTRVKDWIAGQPALVRLQFLAGDSPAARRRFPQLPPGELAVVADTGEVWLGNSAWIAVLWALRDYRDFAVRLAGPLLLPLAREAFTLASRNRQSLSTLLRLGEPREIEQHLRKISVPQCQTQTKSS